MAKNYLLAFAADTPDPKEPRGWPRYEVIPFSQLYYLQLLEPHSLSLNFIVAFLAFELEGLFFRYFCLVMLEWELLPSIALFSSGLVTLAFLCSFSFSCFIDRDIVIGVCLAPWAECPHRFWYSHGSISTSFARPLLIRFNAFSRGILATSSGLNGP